MIDQLASLSGWRHHSPIPPQATRRLWSISADIRADRSSIDGSVWSMWVPGGSESCSPAVGPSVGSVPVCFCRWPLLGDGDQRDARGLTLRRFQDADVTVYYTTTKLQTRTRRFKVSKHENETLIFNRFKPWKLPKKPFFPCEHAAADTLATTRGLRTTLDPDT